MLALLITTAACAQSPTAESVKLFAKLPYYCNTPDALACNPVDNSLLLSVPNFNDTSYPGMIMKVNNDGTSEMFFPGLAHPETNLSGPMGLEFGPDGNLYYCDNQYFFDKNYKSRVVRINMQGGKPVSSEVVVDNIKLANAIRWNGDFMYFSDTFFDMGDPKKEGYGGIYRVSMDEIKKGVVSLIADKNVDDPHLVAKSHCVPNSRGDNAGFDGMCFDSQGNLYSGNFGDGQFYKVSFKTPNGEVSEFKTISRATDCIDGICYDKARDVIYITNSVQNSVLIWDVKKNKMSKLWENGDTDGADGLLDQPCEPLVIGDQVIISNFDHPFPGMKNSGYNKGVHTLSVINLKK